MRVAVLFAITIVLNLALSLAWSQEAASDATESTPKPVTQSDQETASTTMPQKQKGMMKGHHGMGRHCMKHGGRGGKGKGHEMKHGHHQDVLNRLDRIEKRQIIIETMLRELLLNER